MLKNNDVYIFDRREGDFCVLTGDCGSINVDFLPSDARCGDSLIYVDGAFTVLREDSEARRRRVSRKFDDLFKK